MYVNDNGFMFSFVQQAFCTRTTPKHAKVEPVSNCQLWSEDRKWQPSTKSLTRCSRPGTDFDAGVVEWERNEFASAVDVSRV